MALNPGILVNVKFKYLNDIDDLIVVHTQIGRLKFEMVMPYEMATRYILNLRINCSEPRTRKLEN